MGTQGEDDLMTDRVSRILQRGKDLADTYPLTSNVEAADLFGALADLCRGVSVEEAIDVHLSHRDTRVQDLFRELAKS